ncbi:hypothetical protein ACTMU2_41935 [Cupriavidus basilensis]
MHDQQSYKPVLWAPHRSNGYSVGALFDSQRHAAAHGRAVKAAEQGEHENTDEHTKCQLQLPIASHRALKSHTLRPRRPLQADPNC